MDAPATTLTCSSILPVPELQARRSQTTLPSPLSGRYRCLRMERGYETRARDPSNQRAAYSPRPGRVFSRNTETSFVQAIFRDRSDRRSRDSRSELAIHLSLRSPIRPRARRCTREEGEKPRGLSETRRAETASLIALRKHLWESIACRRPA